jgi:hypothetical protein
MTSGATEDPILRMLADLAPPAPSAVRADRVRTRCQAAIARRNRKRAGRSTASRVIDAACFVVLGVYLRGVVTEAVRLGLFGRV